MPFLLKDNIESKGLMATTAGSTALIDNVTGRDSPLVARLRDSGAIILGKANLSQWANFRYRTQYLAGQQLADSKIRMCSIDKLAVQVQVLPYDRRVRRRRSRDRAMARSSVRRK